MVSIGHVCKALGISLSTAYRWIKSGKLQSRFRTPGNHRRFDLSQVYLQFNHSQHDHHKLTILYARVSSHDQKHDLITQEKKLMHYANQYQHQNVTLISDLGSGLNYKKSGLNRLIQLILEQKVKTLILNHKDRLLRFGAEIIFKLCDFYHVNIIILEDKLLSFEETLTHDVIELMTVFCAKLYGKRSHKNKKLTS